tara:strand:+ start:842 stop:2281 length:1440 start_codon:yes stop_codon:yes gene_type:complete
MPTLIAQKPLYSFFPVGQECIFGITNNQVVANKFRVKFIAEVHLSQGSININTTDDVIGTYKTTPNNKGVGIFDFNAILENFVTPDYEGSKQGNGSRYKQATTISVSDATEHPLHIIDLISQSDNCVSYLAIKFTVEYSDTEDGALLSNNQGSNINNQENSIQYTIFNGVIQYDDVLTLSKVDYGYDLELNKLLLKSGDDKFLSNAPRTQYATLEDYGTLPFLNFVDESFSSTGLLEVSKFIFTYYNAGSSVGTETIMQDWDNGGSANFGNPASSKIMYLGAFPGNLRNWSTAFQALVTAGTIDSYTITPYNDTTALDPYTINIVCPSLKSYEPIRLAWLNQWGVWDYYTFNMKSVRSVSTKRIPYSQLGGTWNESSYKISGYKGGKKNFRVNSTEKIKINSDFVSEAEGVWFEELVNSLEVYIINGFQADDANTITNKYVEPVTLTTSSHIRKTIANDKLIQYTFEIEKSKMQRTQSA